MSQFTKSLEKRIQELTAAIDAQKTELAAYERVLHMELSKENAPAEAAGSAKEVSSPVAQPHTPEPVATSEETAASHEAPAKTNKTTLVAEVVKNLGSNGATPKDVDAYFTAHNVERSKNLVYNTLSYLVAHGKLIRRDGKYFALAGAAATATKKKRGPVPGAKKAAAETPTKTKRRLSPEGLQRIKEALRKRWADKKAADSAAKAPASKKAAKKK